MEWEKNKNQLCKFATLKNLPRADSLCFYVVDCGRGGRIWTHRGRKNPSKRCEGCSKSLRAALQAACYGSVLRHFWVPMRPLNGFITDGPANFLERPLLCRNTVFLLCKVDPREAVLEHSRGPKICSNREDGPNRKRTCYRSV